MRNVATKTNEALTSSASAPHDFGSNVDDIACSSWCYQSCDEVFQWSRLIGCQVIGLFDWWFFSTQQLNNPIFLLLFSSFFSAPLPVVGGGVLHNPELFLPLVQQLQLL
jgi:hypothetical protein